MPKILFLNIYYQSFLDQHYRDNPHLRDASYEEQLSSIQATMHGDSDLYSHAMNQIGWKAKDLVINCNGLQNQWAKENSIPLENSEELLIEQIRILRPDVVYTQGTWIMKEGFVAAIKPPVKIITGHCGIPLTDFKAPQFDIIFSSVTFSDV